MIHRKRLAALLLGMSVTFSAFGPMSSLAAVWEKTGTGVYEGSGGTSITGVMARGIDVSHWKQSINWNAVAADDVQFVMLGTRYENAVDPYFDANAKGAYNAGIRVGAYIYSYATTTAMAEQEADFVLSLIKDYPISYPVVIDVEAAEMSSLSPQQLADIINAFCKKIENAGYYPMYYTNEYWLTSKIDTAKIPYDVWAARYDVKPTYNGAAIWQATNQGQVNGISGNVDINFAFKDLASKLPADRWRYINDQWYYYKAYVKQTGWINDGQSWYYLNADGTQYKGWLLYNNEYYYLLPTTGQMAVGWQQVDDGWYYLKEDGRMANEWVLVDGSYYYLLNGKMITKWLRIGSDYYYLKDDGSMVTGWRQLDGYWYYFGEDGRLVRGWQQVDGKYYYLKNDGTMVTGWQTIDNGTSYFSADGVLAQKWQKIGDYWYYFGTDGKMMTGWIQLDGRYYYLHTDGRMVTGWQSDGTNKYYMDLESGKMSVDWKQIDGSWYYFNTSGHMITGWLKIDGKYYYMNPSDGKMISNGSFVINNVNYTFNQNGECLNEASAIDGGSAGSIYTTPSGNGQNVSSGNNVPGGNSNMPGSNSNLPGSNSNLPGGSQLPGGDSNMPGSAAPGGNTNNQMPGNNSNINTPGGSGVTVGNSNNGMGTVPGGNTNSTPNTNAPGSGYPNITTPGGSSNLPGSSQLPGNSNNNSSYPSNNNSNNSYPGISGNNNSYPGNPGSSNNTTPGSNSNNSGPLQQYQTGGPR